MACSERTAAGTSKNTTSGTSSGCCGTPRSTLTSPMRSVPPPTSTRSSACPDSASASASASASRALAPPLYSMPASRITPSVALRAAAGM